MKNIFIILIGIASLASCMTPKRMAKLCAKCPIKDSVSVVVRDSVVLRDSIVVVPPAPLPKDTAQVKFTIECDSLKDIKIKDLTTKLNGAVRPIIIQKGNQITVKCELTPQDSLKIHLRWVERHKVKDTFNQIEKPPVITNELKDWQVALMVIGAMAILFVLGRIFFKIAKNC